MVRRRRTRLNRFKVDRFRLFLPAELEIRGRRSEWIVIVFRHNTFSFGSWCKSCISLAARQVFECNGHGLVASTTCIVIAENDGKRSSCAVVVAGDIHRPVGGSSVHTFNGAPCGERGRLEMNFDTISQTATWPGNKFELSDVHSSRGGSCRSVWICAMARRPESAWLVKRGY